MAPVFYCGCNSNISEVVECIDSSDNPSSHTCVDTPNAMSSSFIHSSPIDVPAKQINTELDNRAANFSRDNSGDTGGSDGGDPKRVPVSHSLSQEENDFEDDDDVIDLNAERDQLNLSRSWKKPDSFSSYSSLNNDECVSFHSQEGVKTSFDLPQHMPSRASVSYNYPRKYSLTVPGEPRHMRTLHRRESGSRSPLNSSCGGLSPSELSTPSPSCSNSM